MNTQATWSRLHELSTELRDHPYANKRGKLRVFAISEQTLHANFAELERSVEAAQSIRIGRGLTGLEGQRAVMPSLINVSVKLHNYVAAAISLAEHARIIYREIYELGRLIPGYDERVDADFSSNGLALLVKELRNLTLHSSHPIIGTEHDESDDPAEYIVRIYLDQSKMITRLDKQVAKTYLIGLGRKPDLMKLFGAHYALFCGFYSWFAEKREGVLDEEAAAMDRLEREIHDLSMELAEHQRMSEEQAIIKPDK